MNDIPNHDMEAAPIGDKRNSNSGLMATLRKTLRLLPVLRKPNPINIAEVKAHIVRLQSEATITAFLAAVQAQILAISIANNRTSLQQKTNILGFLGIMYNVGATFLALLSSALIQTNQIRLESFMENLKRSRFSSLSLVLRQLEDMDYLKQASPLSITMLREAEDIISKKKKQLDEGMEDTNETGVVSQLIDLHVVGDICRYIGTYRALALCSGAFMLYGFLCLVISAALLTINTLPATTWEPILVSTIITVTIAPLIIVFLNPFEMSPYWRKRTER